MFKLKDILVHVWREVKFGCANHLFLLSFLFFVVCVGNLGIWYTAYTSDDSTPFQDAIDKVGMLTYCAPLLSVTIFDACLRALTKLNDRNHSVDISLYMWGAFFTIFLVAIVTIFIVLAPKGVFSYWSLMAGIFSIFYWFVVNASNDAYKKPANNSSPSGDNFNDSSMLLNGRD